MRRLRALACLALLAFAGCATYESPGAAGPGEVTDGGDGGPAVDGQPPEVLAGNENEHLRFALEDHRVEGDQVALFVAFANQDAAGVKRLGYAILSFEATDATLYFDFAANVSAGESKRYRLDAYDQHGLARGAWAALTLYYQEDDGGEFSNDEAVALDLRGRGLPRNVS